MVLIWLCWSSMDYIFRSHLVDQQDQAKIHTLMVVNRLVHSLHNRDIESVDGHMVGSFAYMVEVQLGRLVVILFLPLLKEWLKHLVHIRWTSGQHPVYIRIQTSSIQPKKSNLPSWPVLSFFLMYDVPLGPNWGPFILLKIILKLFYSYFIKSLFNDLSRISLFKSWLFKYMTIRLTLCTRVLYPTQP